MKRRYTVLALVAGVHATAGLIVLAQSQNASPAAADANKGGTATPQGTGAGPFVTQFQSKSLEPDIQHGAIIAAKAPRPARLRVHNATRITVYPMPAARFHVSPASRAAIWLSSFAIRLWRPKQRLHDSYREGAKRPGHGRRRSLLREHERTDLATQATSG